MSEAFFLDDFSPCDIDDTDRGAVNGCAAEDIAKGWLPFCRGFACSMVLVDMASAALEGVVEMALRDDVVTLDMRDSRSAHRRQIMFSIVAIED
jgi:hypothetical protein